jgi:hypothetical protein
MSDEIKIGVSRGGEDKRDLARVVVYQAILGLLGMMYEEESIDDGVIMSALMQAAGTLCYEIITKGGVPVQVWHDALDKAIEVAELNAQGPRQGDVS